MNHWNYSFSRIRSFACVAIVFLHAMTYSMVSARSQGFSLTAAQTVGASLVQYSCMWAVPLFVMVTGALLLDHEKHFSWQKLWKKYIFRVGGAILLFGTLFLVFDLVMNGSAETLGNSAFCTMHPREGSGIGYAFLCGMIDLLTGHSWAHMWYLYMLFGLYLLMPFFKKIADNCSKNDIAAFLAICFVFLSVFPLLGIAGISTDYRFSIATIYPFYLFLGYTLHDRDLPIPRMCVWAILAVSTIAIWVSVFTMVGDPESKLSFLTSYNSVPIVLQAGSLFILMDKSSSEYDVNEQTGGKKALLSFDKASFGIYLIHFLFLKVAFRYLALSPYQHGWVFPVVIPLVIMFSWLITEILKKIPGIRKIV